MESAYCLSDAVILNETLSYFSPLSEEERRKKSEPLLHTTADLPSVRISFPFAEKRMGVRKKNRILSPFFSSAYGSLLLFSDISVTLMNCSLNILICAEHPPVILYHKNAVYATFMCV